MTYAVLDYKTQVEIARFEPPVASEPPLLQAVKDHFSTTSPEKVVENTEALFSPMNALYKAIGCSTEAEFDLYKKAYGLDQLTGAEADAFCLIATKILDARNLRALHEKSGRTYQAILTDLEGKFGHRIHELKRDVLLDELQHELLRL